MSDSSVNSVELDDGNREKKPEKSTEEIENKEKNGRLGAVLELVDINISAKENNLKTEPEKKDDEKDKEAKEFKVPDELKQRYLATENQFFFRNNKTQLAFEDRGKKIVTEHNDPEIAASLVVLAEAKGWGKIKVAGHEDFKREVWLQATLKGIEVTGYKPKEVDYVRLQELQSARAKNSVEQDTGRDIEVKRKGNEKEKDSNTNEYERRDITSKQDKSLDFKGVLLEHGRANYEFDKDKEPSYFVKIDTENGPKIHWGVDLARAVEHSGTKVGEVIELERLGRRPVIVQEKQFDADGKLIGYRSVETERVEWHVGGIEQNKVAELKGDYRIPASVFSQVLKEKGFSPEAIQKVEIEASKRLTQLAERNIPAPGVKVFDRAADRNKPREKIESKTREAVQERSR